MQTAPFQGTQAQSQIRVNSFVRSVYNWMAIGLALTGFTAYFFANSPTLLSMLFQVVGNRLQPTILFYGLIIAELAMVFTLSARVNKMQASTATALFIAYSALNGATLSSIFLIYTSASITSVFFICSATFLATSAYGWMTKKDLTSMGQFMFMGLIGIIIASVVNMFMKSSAMHMIISYIGVVIFVGLTAYDTQKIKYMAMSQPVDATGAMIRKGALIGALTLYLDFINLFLMLLRIFGDRK
ncbi:MAG: Bax inhibitor-1/YccA family protein [Pseudomonadota bacterium]